LKIADPTHPLFAGNHLTIVSGFIVKSNLFSIFNSFSYGAWIVISIIFITTIIINSYRIPDYWSTVTRIVFFDHFLILIGKRKNIINIFLIKLNIFQSIAPMSHYVKKGIYNRLITAILWANSAFWIYLFSSVLLSNLTSKPKLMIESLDEVVRNKDIKVLIDFGSYAYTEIVKVLNHN
jgi:hypothetical protein